MFNPHFVSSILHRLIYDPQSNLVLRERTECEDEEFTWSSIPLSFSFSLRMSFVSSISVEASTNTTSHKKQDPIPTNLKSNYPTNEQATRLKVQSTTRVSVVLAWAVCAPCFLFTFHRVVVPVLDWIAFACLCWCWWPGSVSSCPRFCDCGRPAQLLVLYLPKTKYLLVS